MSNENKQPDERTFKAWCDRFPEISEGERLREAWNDARATTPHPVVVAGSAGQAPIYQISFSDDDGWLDCGKKQFDTHPEHARRIVYATPIAAPTEGSAGQAPDELTHCPQCRAGLQFIECSNCGFDTSNTSGSAGQASEPSAEIVRYEDMGGRTHWDIKIRDKSMPHGTKLYAAPIAALTTDAGAVDRRSVGDSNFEGWYQGYATRLTGNPKQTARDAYAAGMSDAARPSAFGRLVAAHAELLDGNAYCYFELAYTRQTGWMAWITDRPAQGEPGTAEYAKSRKVIARGQGDTAEDACADAMSLIDAARAAEIERSGSAGGEA